MKSKEELNELKEEIESVNKKLLELTPEELAQVTGGTNSEHLAKYGYIALVPIIQPPV